MRVVLAVCSSLWTVVVLGLVAVTAMAPQRNGLLALAEVATPFLFLSLLPFCALAAVPVRGAAMRARRWRTVMRLLLAASLVVAIGRLGPVWVSLPPAAATGLHVGVTSWNLETADADPVAVVDALRLAPIGIVALVELGKPKVGPISADAAIAARFPYQQFFPNDGSTGMGLLSSYPVLATGHSPENPALIWARLDLGEGRTLNVVTAHPMPATLVTLGTLPFPTRYDATQRDAEIRSVRDTVDGLLADGRPLILAGDFNVTDRELAYRDLSAGLLDAHLEVGLGPGSTWRPDPLKWLPLGIVRIDMAFGGNGARPVSMTADCTPRGSDHCLIQASMALP